MKIEISNSFQISYLSWKVYSLYIDILCSNLLSTLTLFLVINQLSQQIFRRYRFSQLIHHLLQVDNQCN